ncbi:MAG: serine protease [Candidatus Omnitrophica bacterium]|nr:serine protease [Candidatus Omnitrophota bacterium]
MNVRIGLTAAAIGMVCALGWCRPVLAAATAPPESSQAERLFQRYKQSVYQVRVIDAATQEKKSVGFGFQFTPAGELATNFHVVSAAVHKPARYRVECLREDGTRESASIVYFNVVHDLAIIRLEQPQSEYIPLGNSELSKGAMLYCIGNPHDLGTAIVSGTFNGIVEKTLYRRILFSGSLNPGMSGGPALDSHGRVVGINVSTAGNEISFLVPVERLAEIYAELQTQPEHAQRSWDKLIEQQLVDNQNYFFQMISSAEWKHATIGDATVPGEISSFFKCWGDSQEEILYRWSVLRCDTDESVSVADDFYTGTMLYQYVWMESTGLNPMQFYSLVRRTFSSGFDDDFAFDNIGNRDDAQRFATRSGIVRSGNQKWKMAVSTRGYVKYAALCDAFIAMASLDNPRKALIVKMQLLGVQKKRLQEFLRKFMEQIQWPG